MKIHIAANADLKQLFVKRFFLSFSGQEKKILILLIQQEEKLKEIEK